MAAKENGKAQAPKRLILPPEVKRAKLEISYRNGGGEMLSTTVGVPMALAKNIVVNTNAKKSIRKSERGGPSDLLVVKLSA